MSVPILGAGAMGSIVAHELARSGKLAPLLLLRSKPALETYNASGGQVTIVTPSPTGTGTSTVPVTATFGPSEFRAKKETIENLVVATKTYNTVQALEPYIPYIGPETNILLLQNGMGVSAALRAAFWTGQSQSPNIFHALSTHGGYKVSPNTVHHVGQGSLVMAKIPAENEVTDGAISAPATPFFDAFLESSTLNASFVGYPEFLVKQMEKLVVNACINPLTAVLDCLNGELLHGKKIYSTMRKIVAECASCFQAEHGSLAKDASSVLNKDRLLSTVLDVCKMTSQNSSSMREDLYRLNQTEIDSINGYIVYLGWKHNIAVPANKMLVDMVKNKLSIERARENHALDQN